MSPHDGREEAARRLLLRLETESRRLLPRLIPAQQQEFAQAATARIWPRIERGEVPDPPPTSYLRRTLHSCFVDEYRRPSSHREVRPEEPDEGTSEDADPERRAMSRQIQAAYRECLDSLSPGRRDAVPLRLMGHSYAEVAEILRCDLKSADNWINRGLRELRGCLREKGLGPEENDS